MEATRTEPKPLLDLPAGTRFFVFDDETKELKEVWFKVLRIAERRRGS